MRQYTDEQIRCAKEKIDEEIRKQRHSLDFDVRYHGNLPQEKRMKTESDGIDLRAASKFRKKYYPSSRPDIFGFKQSSLSLFKKKYQLFTDAGLIYTSGPKSTINIIQCLSPKWGILAHAEAKDNFIYVHYDKHRKSEFIKKWEIDDNAEAEYYAFILNELVELHQLERYKFCSIVEQYDEIPEQYFDMPQPQAPTNDIPLTRTSDADDDDCLPMFF